jgi:2,4-dienoyl-CoA reductase-like NADH-dependent reductase (Old Yellow Enzyme family)
MQETCAEPPNFDPPVDKFRALYSTWANARYGMLLTGQVQVDLRFFSLPGDVCCHEASLDEPILAKWKEWARIAQTGGTPCVVQISHPGRTSIVGAGIRPVDMAPLCPSSVPVKVGNTWLDKVVVEKLLATPKAMNLNEIDEAVANFVRAARLAHRAGFAGIQLHAAHGFLISQFLSPHTNRRTDEYGGTREKRLRFLQRLINEVRVVCPPPFCVGVKINSADYMENGGLTQDEALEQVRWLVECGKVDFVDISGGNAEATTCELHNTFGRKTLERAPRRKSTRIREAFFTDFAEKVERLHSRVPIQLSGGWCSRNGMADAIDNGLCQLIGLGRQLSCNPRCQRISC